ncbi:hypothetical protein P154DRAFT_522148 [Amniculicola lignicola CBS 123094]|uniref:Micro-fibrillar-associated protein 1 C-terminal domain-containing protein n=1 Tax=Amniculicola lignicola CBS 123094 TaxID=1392246 RepID=A0A6A5WTG1_9PLEO|nr:hypothetical protein P154DRAFT_522148 [Amniculicola lignicola CBS 123094]
MPLPGAKKRMTAQPKRVRMFNPKSIEPEVNEPSTASESESEEEKSVPLPWAKPKPAPVASSFKALPKRPSAKLPTSNVDLKRLEDEYETASEESGDEGGKSESESGGESGSDEEDDDEEESSSSESDAPARKFVRPIFRKQADRERDAQKTAEQRAEEEEKRKQDEIRTLVQEQIDARQAAKATRKDWDDDVEEADIDAIDDTDGLDPEGEYAAWKLREFKRIKRERDAIEEAEAERNEIERRRNLSAAERDAEDRAFIDKQKEEREGRGQMDFMQKYHHKGAFYQEELKELGVDGRNVMGARFEDATNKELLPEYMKIRDMNKLGKKGRTRYKDMRSEDTGVWGAFADDRRGPRDKTTAGLDDRYQSDRYQGRRDDDGPGVTGANAKPLGERKRVGEEDRRDGKRPRVE